MKLPNLGPSASRTLQATRIGDRLATGGGTAPGHRRVTSLQESDTYTCQCTDDGQVLGTVTCLKSQTCQWNSTASTCDCVT